MNKNSKKTGFSLKLEKYINFFAGKYANNDWLYEDIKQELYIVCLNCREYYKSGLSSFETFCVKSIKIHIAGHFRKQSKLKRQSGRHENIENFKQKIETAIGDIDFSLYFEEEIQVKIFDMLINQKLKLVDISQELGMKKNHIKQIYKKALLQIQKELL